MRIILAAIAVASLIATTLPQMSAHVPAEAVISIVR